jgi:hypothetical protein
LLNNPVTHSNRDKGRFEVGLMQNKIIVSANTWIESRVLSTHRRRTVKPHATSSSPPAETTSASPSPPVASIQRKCTHPSHRQSVEHLEESKQTVSAISKHCTKSFSRGHYSGVLQFAEQRHTKHNPVANLVWLLLLLLPPQ